jgi:flavin reductase (DIM6/NTAB) family NADH-FMN oxidoreductase RutF
MMLTITPGEIPTSDLHQFITGAVAPRPIAFASTIDNDGVANLAPYSFFNAFSSNPPILIFSSNRRVEGNTTKDTLANCQANGEVVINVVTREIVRQMALSSVDYRPQVDEFEKAGFTKLASELVRPYRVAESPIQMECKVQEILPLGKEGGAGNLIICEIVRMHIAEEVVTNGRIDPQKIHLMARMGRFYYAEASGKAVSEIMQRVDVIGVGFDQLPNSARTSKVLTGNDLAQIAALPAIPTDTEIHDFMASGASAGLHGCTHIQAHKRVREALKKGDIKGAAILLYATELLTLLAKK